MERPGRQLSGVVAETLPQGLYRVACEDGEQIIASVSPLARKVTVRILPGDRVTVERSPVDPGRGRITAKKA